TQRTCPLLSRPRIVTHRSLRQQPFDASGSHEYSLSNADGVRSRGLRMKRLCVYTAAVACAVVAPMAIGGHAAQENTTNPDISGFWELNFDSRQVPRAS